MTREILGTHQKALQINLDSKFYGTFAEIGAGQEVARWFFRVGGAAGTVAKSMSAYDMLFSDAIYGPAERYVCRHRLEGMLSHELELLNERLGVKRGATTNFFVFADTVAAQSFKGNNECHGWLGVSFQLHPNAEPNDILIHVRMLDRENVQQQEALGIIGVNLIYGAFYFNHNPRLLIESLLDNLTIDRLEIDMMTFRGPDFATVDNRIVSMELMSHGLTNAAIFDPSGEVLQPTEILYKKCLLLERGSFRPVTKVNLEMLETARTQFLQESRAAGEKTVELMEITVNNLMESTDVDYQDYLARIEILNSIGKTVLVSNYSEFHRLAGFLSRMRPKLIGIALGIPTLKELLNEKYYADLDGGILESFGRLFKNDVKLYIYPARDPESGQIISAKEVDVAPHLKHLYNHLLENRYIVPLHAKHASDLGFSSRDVIASIAAGDKKWEGMVTPKVAQIIREKKYFGCGK